MNSPQIPIFLLVLCFHTVLPLPTMAALALGVAVSVAHLAAFALCGGLAQHGLEKKVRKFGSVVTCSLQK